MTLHRNAKTTPAARALLVQRVLHERWTYAEVAEGTGSVSGPWPSGFADIGGALSCWGE
jgi:hypothetical protein